MAYDQDLADLIRRLFGPDPDLPDPDLPDPDLPDPDLTVIESQRGWPVLEAR